MSDDFDDFLDGPAGLDDEEPKAVQPKTKRKANPSRPSGADTPTAKARAANATVLATLAQPVSITFLAQVWNLDKGTVKKRLVDLPPIDQHRGNQPLYDYRQASQYLVVPRINARDFIKRMSVGDLPKELQKDVWDARLKEQTWRERAGDLWRTSDVLEVLSEAFVQLKTTSQLWVDVIADDHALPVEARNDLMKNVDALQTQMHRALVQMPTEKATHSQEAEMDEENDDGK